MSSFESGADISIIIDIFTQKGAECSRKRQFNSRTAHFLNHSPSSPLPILFPKPQRPRLILFFSFCFSLSLSASYSLHTSSLCISISLSLSVSLCAWQGPVPQHWLFGAFHLSASHCSLLNTFTCLTLKLCCLCIPACVCSAGRLCDCSQGNCRQQLQ